MERLLSIPDPPSLVDLRRRVTAMLPRVDLPEVILEGMAWCPGFVAAFTAAAGGQSRLVDLDGSIAAWLTAQALNVGFNAAELAHSDSRTLGAPRRSPRAMATQRVESRVLGALPLLLHVCRLGRTYRWWREWRQN